MQRDFHYSMTKTKVCIYEISLRIKKMLDLRKLSRFRRNDSKLGISAGWHLELIKDFEE